MNLYLECQVVFLTQEYFNGLTQAKVTYIYLTAGGEQSPQKGFSVWTGSLNCN